MRNIHRSVWALGFVSMFMDMSSEMIHALLPVFLVTTLGASAATVGLIEGLAEATASITKLFSGTLSDYFRKRKLLTLIGYGMAALTKPLFPLASSATWVLAARFLDRIGKGIRGAPRDALVADVTPGHLRGASYGLRQSLDTIGAFAGPLMAILLMLAFNNIRLVFWIAIIPAALCVLILYFGVKEPELKQDEANQPKTRLRFSDISMLTHHFWYIILLAVLLNFARFSEAFLVLKASHTGLSNTFIPMVLVAMNVVYALSSYPAGWLSDRISRKYLLTVGFMVLILADIVLGFSSNLVGVFAGIALWGLHMGLTQGLFAALVADSTPSKLRGSAFGIYNVTGGLAMLLSSVIAGRLWDVLSPTATFAFGAGVAAVGLGAVLVVFRPSQQ